MSMSPHEIDSLAEALAVRLLPRLASHMNDSDIMLDSHGAAQLLGCSVPTIERLTRSGEIPSTKFGRLRRYRRADLIGRRNDKAGDE